MGGDARDAPCAASCRDLMPWPYLPTVLETESGTRPTDPRNDTTPLGNGHRAVAEHVRADMWATFNNHKKQGVRVAYWMWHGQIKVRMWSLGMCVCVCVCMTYQRLFLLDAHNERKCASWCCSCCEIRARKFIDN